MTGQVGVRTAKEADFDRRFLAGAHGEYRASLLDAFHQGDLVLVAEEDGSVVGQVTVHWHPSAMISHLAVAEEQRRRGIGSMLLVAAETAARSKGCPSLGLTVGRENQRAIELYRRRGFAVTGETMSDGLVLADGTVIHEREPVWTMTKPLGPTTA